ncbi:MAG: peptidyl-prolyl cis-trans isomerase [Campylobacter sp.]|nr:peptidyl-prolyl cis-trans isomerase [Campylobacter sp.]
MGEIIFRNYLNKGFIMLKKAIFASLVCAICLQADTVNAVAAIVENEPITLYEIEKVRQDLKISSAHAFDLLVRDRLEQSQIKALGISVSPFEINDRVENMAKKNGLTNNEFRNQIEEKGIRFIDFKKDLEKSMLQEKLYKNIFAGVGKNINERNARTYYENNVGQFSTFESISVTVYSAKDGNLLMQQQQSGLDPLKGVKTQVLKLNYENISQRLAVLLATTPERSFTRPLQGPNGYDMFYVNVKNGSRQPSFEEIKDEVMNMLFQAEQEKVATDYFDKLRAKAKINFLRQPQ